MPSPSRLAAALRLSGDEPPPPEPPSSSSPQATTPSATTSIATTATISLVHRKPLSSMRPPRVRWHPQTPSWRLRKRPTLFAISISTLSFRGLSSAKRSRWRALTGRARQASLPNSSMILCFSPEESRWLSPQCSKSSTSSSAASAARRATAPASTASTPRPGEPWARVAGGLGRRRRRVRAASARGVRVPGVAVAAGERARAAAVPARRRDPGGLRAHRVAGDARQRQALPRDADPASARAEVDPLLRRDGRQGRGRHDPARPAERPELHRAGAARRRRDRHAVELAGVPHHDGRRAGAGRGQHRGRQAVGGDVGVDARGGRARRTASASRPASSTSSPGSATPARRSSSTRWSTRSRSRAGWRPAGPSARPRPSASRRSRSSSAASRRTSCSRTPTSTRPSPACSRASSPPPARRAWRDRARSCTSRSTTSWPSA